MSQVIRTALRRARPYQPELPLRPFAVVAGDPAPAISEDAVGYAPYEARGEEAFGKIPERRKVRRARHLHRNEAEKHDEAEVLDQQHDRRRIRLGRRRVLAGIGVGQMHTAADDVPQQQCDKNHERIPVLGLQLGRYDVILQRDAGEDRERGDDDFYDLLEFRSPGRRCGQDFFAEGEDSFRGGPHASDLRHVKPRCGTGPAGNHRLIIMIVRADQFRIAGPSAAGAIEAPSRPAARPRAAAQSQFLPPAASWRRR